ncbi:MAG: histidinol-phosphate transaminase [Tissierellia bacterium]|nr:histidinol-phosphate transaminase [Tissierellia bacterium]
MIHGGDTKTYGEKYGQAMVDFSSNINPCGPPALFKEVLAGAYQAMTTYPDPYYRDLRASLAGYLSCRAQEVLVGNGAMDIIDGAIRVFDRVIIAYPAFVEYELRAQINEKDLVHIPMREDLRPDIPALIGAMEEGSLLILGNPNNPTGFRLKEEDLLALYEAALRKGTTLLLDEAFYEFCPEDYDSVALFKKTHYQQVIIIRAATKFFAIPGLRLGYGVTHEAIKAQIEAYLHPWRVNSMADALGQTLPDLEDYARRSRAYVAGERTFLLEELKKLKGLRAYPSLANYILIGLERDSGSFLQDFLGARGLLIRRCENFRGLNDDYIRIAVKGREANLKLIQALKEYEKRSCSGV